MQREDCMLMVDLYRQEKTKSFKTLSVLLADEFLYTIFKNGKRNKKLPKAVSEKQEIPKSRLFFSICEWGTSLSA